MSVDYLQLIPSDPLHVPPAEAQLAARDKLLQIIPLSPEITVEAFATPQFIDQGENFERVSCPFCNQILKNNWWGKVMDKAYENLFDDLTVILRCCDRQSSLNDLSYELPAGFSCFVLSARNPNRDDLTNAEKVAIEAVLNCKIKLIRATY